MSTIKEVDRIAVVVDGSIIEIGTHSELYQMGGVYSRLHDRQLAAWSTLNYCPKVINHEHLCEEWRHGRLVARAH